MFIDPEKEGAGREKERDIDPSPPVRTPTGDQTLNLLVYGPRSEQLSHWAGAMGLKF